MFNPDVSHYLEHMGNAVAHLPRSDNPLLPRCRLSASRWFRAPVDASRRVCHNCLRAAAAPAPAASSHRRKIHEPQVVEVALWVWPEYLGWGLAPAAPVRFRCVGRPGVQGGAWRLELAEALDPVPAGRDARRQGLVVALQRALEPHVGAVDKFYHNMIVLESPAAGREAA